VKAVIPVLNTKPQEVIACIEIKIQSISNPDIVIESIRKMESEYNILNTAGL
jgi:hypothetical protein